MVIWTPRAQSDLKAIHDYIAKDAPLNVKHIIQDIVRKADILLSFPKAGKKSSTSITIMFAKFTFTHGVSFTI
jgi:plasmid stabilization system protein ParE